MRKIKIFTDSTSDLTPKLLERFDIGIVPLYVVFGETSYRDGVDMVPGTLYRLVDETGNLPKTSAPSPGDFLSHFEPFIQDGFDILYIGLSSEISSTIQNATIAANQFEEGRITVIDSRNLCTGIGLQVVQAARLAEEGKTVQEITTYLLNKRGDIESEFLIDTLDYLHKGGRCSSVQALIGNMLKIRPIVKVVDGKMIVPVKIRGKREKALQQLLDNALVNARQMVPGTLYVAHSYALEEAEYLRDELARATGEKDIPITEAGCVISSHCGRQTVGIFYMKA
ncbi:DegV family protein [Gorillibacterium timonense]|uniref:DegV family protein n=1 Tax=Gorillibacterium timonense TaxID=1689269 RepID=UPI00071D4B57|nr:DegV family protein [Gorillibacterium timonense]